MGLANNFWDRKALVNWIPKSNCHSKIREPGSFHTWSGQTEEQAYRPVAITHTIIPALCEAKVGGSQGQEMESILANMVKPCLYLKNTNLYLVVVVHACSPSYTGG